MPVAAIDFGDLVELAPILLPVGLWVLSRLAAAVRGMNNAPPGRPQPFPPDVVRDLRRGPAPGRAAPPRPPAPARLPVPVAGRGEPPVAADPAFDLAKQIEEFLARGQGSAVRKPSPPPPAAARPPGTERRASRHGERKDPRQPPRPMPVAKAPAPPAAPTDLGRLPTDVSRHVEAAFRQESRTLTATEPAALTVATTPQHPVVAELVAAIRDPRALQRMILVREILDRPVDRW
jgi:hypothetical protein